MADMDIKDSDLSLKRLADMLPKVKPERRSFTEMMAEGLDEFPDVDVPPIEKSINVRIYEGFLMYSGTPAMAASHYQFLDMVKQRVRGLFPVKRGFEGDIYNMGRDYIADVLVKDAIKNNTRDFLPDELIPEYDRLVAAK